jgi:hypothetical protein
MLVGSPMVRARLGIHIIRAAEPNTELDLSRRCLPRDVVLVVDSPAARGRGTGGKLHHVAGLGIRLESLSAALQDVCGQLADKSFRLIGRGYASLAEVDLALLGVEDLEFECLFISPCDDAGVDAANKFILAIAFCTSRGLHT